MLPGRDLSLVAGPAFGERWPRRDLVLGQVSVRGELVVAQWRVGLRSLGWWMVLRSAVPGMQWGRVPFVVLRPVERRSRTLGVGEGRPEDSLNDRVVLSGVVVGGAPVVVVAGADVTACRFWMERWVVAMWAVSGACPTFPGGRRGRRVGQVGSSAGRVRGGGGWVA